VGISVLPQTTQGVAEMLLNADSVLTGSGITSRVELVLLASKLSRTRKISAVKALMLLETGEVDIEELRETILFDLQQVKPEPESIKDDTTAQPK
jgi:hypothetical protein|tara:strand:- start:1016 stop:1300 length:285 start_codon:yes stop_codon:yes gene_type:complete